MRKNYACTTTFPAHFLFFFLFVLCFSLYIRPAVAQTLYRAVSASQVEKVIEANIERASPMLIQSSGTYLIKDGQLDDIYNLKLIFPSVKLDSLIGNKPVTFEQTRIMVLPIMGMVHIVGTLDVDGAKSTTDFQLGFSINNDQSITFKGTKSFKLDDLVKGMSNQELKLDIDFVLKQDKNILVTLTSR